LSELLEPELPQLGAQLHEGEDFVKPQELLALREATEAKLYCVPPWALLVLQTLRELLWEHYTGQLPGGKPYTEQPAWRVELWEAYWRSKGAFTP